MKKLLFICVCALSSQSVFGQSNVEGDMSFLNFKKPAKKIAVMLDGTSVLLKGAGVKATYQIGENIAVGGAVKRFKLRSEDSSFKDWSYTYEHEITSVGFVIDYLPTNLKSEAGLYFSGAVMSSQVKTKVYDSYFGDESSEDTDLGLQAKAGYQFVSPLNPGLDMLFQLGLGYGSAGAVSWRYGGSKTELQNGLQIDLSAGAQF